MVIQVYKGKGRRARRVVHTRSGGLLFRVITGWLCGGVTFAR